MGRPQLPPILLGELRRAGVAVTVIGPICKRAAEMSPHVVRLPDTTDMNTLGHAMRCTGCNRKGGPRATPFPRQWVRYLRATGQRHREPWYAPMMSDE